LTSKVKVESESRMMKGNGGYEINHFYIVVTC